MAVCSKMRGKNEVTRWGTWLLCRNQSRARRTRPSVEAGHSDLDAQLDVRNVRAVGPPSAVRTAHAEGGQSRQTSLSS